MGSGYEKDVKKILQKHDCHYVRGAKGSHEFWFSPITDRHFTVPKKIKPKQTANAIMKQAGINHRF